MPMKSHAPDGGWGWMVVLGCSMMHAIVAGLNRSFSLIYMELQTRYDSSAALTAAVGGCSVALRMGLAPLATGLSARFGARRVTMVGGVLVGFGICLCAFATSTMYMFFSYSIMTGIGGSLVFAPAVVLVGQYFNKTRAIAVGISTGGTGLGVFSIPFLMRYLFNEYSFFGCMLIIGAIEFNNIVCSALYRPLHTTVTPTSEEEEEEEEEERHVSKNSLKLKQSSDHLEKGNMEHINVPEDTSHSSSTFPEDTSDLKITQFQNSEVNVHEHKSNSCSNLNKYLNFQLWTNPTFVCYAVAMGLKTMTYIPSEMLLPDHAIRSGVPMSYAAMLVSVSGISDAVGRVVVGLLFDMPRIRRHRRHYFTAALLCLGLGVCTFSFSWGLGMFLTFTIINGFLTGAVVGQRSVVVADLVGVENLPSAFGFMVFMQGCGLLIGPPIAGLLKDVTGVYSLSYVFMGSASVLSAAILFAEYIFVSRWKRPISTH